MALSTLTTTTAPNLGLSSQVTPRVKENSYGDGYSQRTGDGLNTSLRAYSLVWGPITPAEADQIEAFLLARGSVEAFYWRTPREVAQNLPAKKYRCKSWQRSSPQWNSDQVNATFTEVADLGT